LTFADHEFTIVLPDGTTKVLQEEDIASISGGEPKESNYWSASVFLGIDVITGNSEQVVITSKANVQRRTASTRFIADYLGKYTQVDNNRTTADSDRVNASFDIYQTSHFYWRAVSLEYLRDPFKNIRGRYTVYVGIGYDIIYTPKTDWSVTMGPGYQHTSFDDYNASDPTAIASADTPLFVLDSKFNTEITNDIDFILNYNMFYVNEESGRYVHHAQVSLETELIKDFDLDLSIYWDRTQSPVAFSDGTFPEQNDFTSMLSVGYSY
jgi:putative salt-induced outer membrane protein YdiY